jgi:hypothetical protein
MGKAKSGNASRELFEQFKRLSHDEQIQFVASCYDDQEWNAVKNAILAGIDAARRERIESAQRTAKYLQDYYASEIEDLQKVASNGKNFLRVPKMTARDELLYQMVKIDGKTNGQAGAAIAPHNNGTKMNAGAVKEAIKRHEKRVGIR